MPPIDIRGFMRSKEFLITGIIAACVVVGGVAALAGPLSDLTLSTRPGCFIEPNPGSNLETVVDQPAATVHADGRYVRTVTFRTAEVNATRGILDACTSVGDITIRASPDNATTVTATFTGDTEDAVLDASVRAAFRQDGGTFVIEASQPRVTRTGSFLLGETTTRVAIEILVPAAIPFTAKLHSSVGQMILDGITLDGIDAETHVGEIRGSRLSVSGIARFTTDVGDIVLGIAEAGNGTLTLRTDVGDTDIVMPRSGPRGYDVSGATDVGSVRIDIPDPDLEQRTRDIPGESVHVRTRSFNEKSIRVMIDVRVDVGSIYVITR